MNQKHSERRSNSDGPVPQQESAVVLRAFSDNWLKKFLIALTAIFGTLALALWLYGLWGYVGVVAPAREALITEDDDRLKETLISLSTPHLFAGFEPYYGFGTDKGAAMNERVSALVATGAEYTPAQVRFLTRQVAFFIPAFVESKVDGKIPIVAGDRAVISNLEIRWANALHTGIVFAIHLTIISLIIGTLLLVYVRFNLFDGITRAPGSGD